MHSVLLRQSLKFFPITAFVVFIVDVSFSTKQSGSKKESVRFLMGNDSVVNFLHKVLSLFNKWKCTKKLQEYSKEQVLSALAEGSTAASITRYLRLRIWEDCFVVVVLFCLIFVPFVFLLAFVVGIFACIILTPF